MKQGPETVTIMRRSSSKKMTIGTSTIPEIDDLTLDQVDLDESSLPAEASSSELCEIASLRWFTLSLYQP